jgi:hypothetical protein
LYVLLAHWVVEQIENVGQGNFEQTEPGKLEHFEPGSLEPIEWGNFEQFEREPAEAEVAGSNWKRFRKHLGLGLMADLKRHCMIRQLMKHSFG